MIDNLLKNKIHNLEIQMTNLANKILANDNYDEVMLACKLSKLKFKLNLLKIKNQKYEVQR